MPHASVTITAGAVQTETPALNSAGISSCNNIRLKPDPKGIILPEKIGGWAKFYGSSLVSLARALWAWEDINANKWLAVGLQSQTSGANAGQAQLGVMSGVANAQGITQATAYTDITPQQTTDSVAVSFATTAGSPTVTITDATTTGITGYTSVYLTVPVSVGGFVLSGLYQAASVNSTQYTIQAANLLGSPLGATYSTSTGITVTGGSASGTAVTLTWSTPSYTFPTGEAIIVAGLTPSAWNGTYIVTSSTGTSVVYASTAVAGSWSSGGTINNGGVVPLFTTTNASTIVTVTLPDHGLSAGSTFTSLVATAIGGITFFGNYVVQTVPNSYSFTIIAGQTATSSASGYENSGLERFIYSVGKGAGTARTGYGVGGYGTGGYGSGSIITSVTGTPIAASQWSLDNWGQQLIASPYGNYPVGTSPTAIPYQPIYVWDPTSNIPIATAIPQAPPVNMGCFVAMPQRQIVAWGSSFTGIIDPLLVRWCDVSNYNVWVAQITNQAGSYRLSRGSGIVGALQSPQQAFLWTDTDLWSMQYIGAPYVYSFNIVGMGCGLIARRAAGMLGGVTYWMGKEQFFSTGTTTAGVTSTGVMPLQCPIWDVVFQELDQTSVGNIVCSVNSLFGEITWYYPISANVGTDSAGLPTNYVRYNTYIGQWDFGQLTRTAAIDVSVMGPPILASADPYIYQHEISPDGDNQAISPSFTTGYFALSEGDSKVFVDQFWIDMKWGYYSSAQAASVSVTFNGVDYPGQTPYAYGPYPLTSASTFISPRIRARLLSMTFSSSDIGTWWRLGNCRYRFQPDGKI